MGVCKVETARSGDAPLLVPRFGYEVVVDEALFIALSGTARQAQFGIEHCTAAHPRHIRAAIIIGTEIIGDQSQVAAAAFIIEDPARTVMFVAVDLLVPAAVDICDIAIEAAVETSHASGQPFAKRAGKGGAQPPLIAFEPIGSALGFKFVTAAARNDIHNARRGIAPEQRALRSAQHFQPFDIDQIHKSLA